ncbi:MAG: hypothetical protein L6428_16330 [Candidatus Aminicenantes bacterium]|nr:hypothetical protein [Candidatus Aminicenantes bacterium]
MGTSKSMPTPKGGKWTRVKREISSYVSGSGNISPQQIIGSTIIASGGLSLRSTKENLGRSGGGVGKTGGRRAQNAGGSPLGRAASGLAGFGTTLGARDLSQALNLIGIDDMRGKPAGEVISKIADHLSKGLHGLEQDLMRNAIIQAILNAAEIAGDPTYENLEASLQAFLSRDGVEGLIELFLTQYIFYRIWHIIEDHVNKRTDNQGDISNMEVAVEQACRSNVHDEVEYQKKVGSFDNLDWFGVDGLQVAETIVSDLEDRLRAYGAGQ